MTEPDYYKILGVSTSATSTEVKRRFVELSKKIHPDHGGDDSLMALVNEAYKTLSNPTLRRQYDGRKNATSRAREGDEYGRAQNAGPTPSSHGAYAKTNAHQERRNAAHPGTAWRPTEPRLTEQEMRASEALNARIVKTEWHIKHGTGYWLFCGFGAFVVLAGWSSPYVSQTSLIFWATTLSITGAYLYQQMLRAGLDRLEHKAGMTPTFKRSGNNRAAGILLALLLILFVVLLSNPSNSTSAINQTPPGLSATPTPIVTPVQAVINSKRQYYAPANAANFTSSDEATVATTCLSEQGMASYPYTNQIRYCGCALGSVEQNYTPAQIEQARMGGYFSTLESQSQTTINTYCSNLL